MYPVTSYHSISLGFILILSSHLRPYLPSCFFHSVFHHHHHHHHHHWKNSPFWATAFRRRFCQICLKLDLPVLTSSNFAVKLFFQSKVVSPVSNPQPEGLVTEWSIYTPTHRVFHIQNIYLFRVSLMRYMPCPSHPPWADDPNNMWRGLVSQY
jgi:hypothetical protein